MVFENSIEKAHVGPIEKILKSSKGFQTPDAVQQLITELFQGYDNVTRELEYFVYKLETGKVLEKWIDVKKSEAVFKTLISAVRRLDCNDTAEKIEALAKSDDEYFLPAPDEMCVFL